MEKRDFIWWLLKFQVENNLEESFRKSSRTNGLEEVITGDDGRSLRENTETPYHPGLLFLANGVASLNKLIKKRWVPYDREEDISEFDNVKDYRDFAEYIKRVTESGGEGTAYAFNAEHQKITAVPEFTNSPESPFYNRITRKVNQMLGRKNESLVDAVPGDFLSLKKEIPVSGNRLGTKTGIAIRLSRDNSDVHAYQVRRTVYGELGLGKVTWFDQDGLREEIYLDRKANALAYIDPERKIVAIHRSYRDMKGEPFRDEDGKLTPFVERFISREELNQRAELSYKQMPKTYGKVA